MKKIFTLLTLLVCVCTGAWATDVTFGFAEGNVSVATFHSTNNSIITSGPISLIGHSVISSGTKIISRNGSSDELKFQASTAITVYAGPSATITEVVITQTSTTRDFSIESGHGSISRSNKVVTWTGSRNSIKITNSNSNAYVESIKVTYTTNPGITGTTAIWDFQNGNPATLETESVNSGIEGIEDNVTSSVASIIMHVNTKKGAAYENVTGKLKYRSGNGDAQCNKGTIMQVPVKGTSDVVFLAPKSGGYTIGGGSETTLATLYTATASDVAQGYVEIICSTNGYLYKISVSQYSAAVTVGATGWSTFASTQALDFEHATPAGLSAYMVTGATGTAITKSDAVTNVPGSTGLLLNGTANATYTIPVLASSTTDVSANKLKPGTGAAVNYNDNSSLNYVLVNNGATAEFQKIVSGTYSSAVIPVGKAYLSLTEAPAREILDIDPVITGIENVNRETITNNQYFDLQGRRVLYPTKGLYIVNGKKVILK